MSEYSLRRAELEESDKVFWDLCSAFYGGLRKLHLFSEVELGLTGLGNYAPEFRAKSRELYNRLPTEWKFRADAFFAICARRREAYAKLSKMELA